MENKQTAVEWLAEYLKPSIALQTKYIDEYVKYAKQMEKEQIIDAATWGYISQSGEQYYNETYGR